MAPRKASRTRRLFHACLLGGGAVFSVAALVIAASAGAYDPRAELRTNPFARPALSSGAPKPTNATGPVVSTGAPSQLRFTLAAGRDSLVNVDGKTLRLGEEINGYRLDAVRAESAIFTKGAEIIELRIPSKDIRKRK